MKRSIPPATASGNGSVTRSLILGATMYLILPLSACDRSPSTIGFDRGGYRADAIAACSDGMRMGGAARDVADRICTCGADRFLSGKSDVQLQALTEDTQQQGMRAAVQTCLEREQDLGPLPDDLARPGGATANQGLDPNLPAAPPAEPDSNTAGAENGEDRPIDQARPGIETGDDRAQTGNEANASRWRQPPR
jgi:hypothetical protein